LKQGGLGQEKVGVLTRGVGSLVNIKLVTRSNKRISRSSLFSKMSYLSFYVSIVEAVLHLFLFGTECKK